jgi:hypothetical protein
MACRVATATWRFKTRSIPGGGFRPGGLVRKARNRACAWMAVRPRRQVWRTRRARSTMSAAYWARRAGV